MSMQQIPATAYVPCPAITFKNRAARKCLDCQHFGGFIDTAPKSESAAFEARFRVQCTHPIARRMTCIEVE